MEDVSVTDKRTTRDILRELTQMAVEDGTYGQPSPNTRRKTELLIDPDCKGGKCGSCMGDPCEHYCHLKAKHVEAIMKKWDESAIVCDHGQILPFSTAADEGWQVVEGFLAEREGLLQAITLMSQCMDERDRLERQMNAVLTAAAGIHRGLIRDYCDTTCPGCRIEKAATTIPDDD